MADFNDIIYIYLQRPVPKLSKGLAVSPPSPGHLGCSAAPPAPVGPGSLVSAHTGHKHCWLPSGAALWHGQVKIRTILWIHAAAAGAIRQQTYFFFTCYLLSSQGENCPPPPPVSWGRVTGLQTSLLGHLKAFMKSLDNPVQRESSLALIPAYLTYLHAYYHQLSKQVLLSDVHFPNRHSSNFKERSVISYLVSKID